MILDRTPYIDSLTSDHEFCLLEVAFEQVQILLL